MFKPRSFCMLVCFCLMIGLSACAAPNNSGDVIVINEPNSEEPVASDDPIAEPVPAQQDDIELEFGEKAYVDSIEIVFMESFPLQVMATVHGSLPDGCTNIKEITVDFEKNVFAIHIHTQRPKDMMCSQAMRPFEENVSLDVYGLPKGTYQVIAKDFQAEFTFEQDNSIPD